MQMHQETDLSRIRKGIGRNCRYDFERDSKLATELNKRRAEKSLLLKNEKQKAKCVDINRFWRLLKNGNELLAEHRLLRGPEMIRAMLSAHFVSAEPHRPADED